MSDVERLLSAFRQGRLLRPSPEVPGLVDLARGLATLAGVPDVTPSRFSDDLAGRIGSAEHIVMVLADGLGIDLIEASASAGGFLRSHLAGELRTVFPSTTAVALTSWATGEWPARHAITGWWTYLPAIRDAATLLPFTRRLDDRPLQDLDVRPEVAFPLASMWGRATREMACIQPARIASSTYSGYANGGRVCSGYRSLREAFETVLTAVEEASGPAFTYLYLPHVDAAAHEYGLDAPEVHGALSAIEAELHRLAGRLDGRARIVLTSDHGHLAVPEVRRHRIEHGGALSKMLSCLPSGDLRTPVFHVRAGEQEAFASGFRARFGERFVLLTPGEVEALELLGPGPLSAEMRERLGDFMALSLGRDMLAYVDANGDRHALMQPSHHSGLSPAEVRIPLVLA